MSRISTLIAATREVLATRDLSTGLLKREAFERSVDDWVGGGDARRPATTLLMVQVGVAGAPLADRPDRALLLDLARDVQRLLRATDIAGHVDEDTLGILLPSTPVEQGTRAAERILQSFRDSTRAKNGKLAATIGVSGAGNLEPWLAALQSLREARLAGGDCVVVAPSRYSAVGDDAVGADVAPTNRDIDDVDTTAPDGVPDEPSAKTDAAAPSAATETDDAVPPAADPGDGNIPGLTDVKTAGDDA